LAAEMAKILVFWMIYILGESLAFFVFKLVNFLLLKTRDLKLNLSVIKGMIERLFLFLALVYGIPHALIAFGAIKIAPISNCHNALVRQPTENKRMESIMGNSGS
jgi:hypothetical protein